MWYILNLDHHGYWQGIHYKFKTQKKAKEFADTQQVRSVENFRVGRVGYHRWPEDGTTTYAYVIFESNVVLKGKNGGTDFETPEEGTPKGEEFWTTVENLLNILERKRRLFTDWEEDEDSTDDEADGDQSRG